VLLAVLHALLHFLTAWRFCTGADQQQCGGIFMHVGLYASYLVGHLPAAFDALLHLVTAVLACM
jgi:hypothetical protein